MFFKKLEQLTEEDIFMEKNVNTFNTCLRLTNEVKFFENKVNNDMNKKVKQLIKDYQIFLNQVLKTHEPTKEIKT